MIWNSASFTTFVRVFRLQERAIRVIITGVKKQEYHVSISFDHLKCNITITGTLYNYMKIMFMYYKFKSSSITTGRDLHKYNTREKKIIKPVQKET